MNSWLVIRGIERLALLPLLLSLVVLLRNWRGLLAVPLWLAVLALMAAFRWIIGWFAAEFRRRLNLYKFLLDEALHASMLEQPGHQSAQAE